MIWKPGWKQKMENPPRKIVGNVHVLAAGRSAKTVSRHLTKSYLAKNFKDAWVYNLPKKDCPPEIDFSELI